MSYKLLDVLCLEIVAPFGEIVKTVCKDLLVYGPSTIQQIINRTKLNKYETKIAVYTMINHQFVTTILIFEKQNQRSVVKYKVFRNSIVLRLRYPKFIWYVKKAFDSPIERQIVEYLLSVGRETKKNIISEQLTKLENSDKKTKKQVKKAFEKLLNKGFLKKTKMNGYNNEIITEEIISKKNQIVKYIEIEKEKERNRKTKSKKPKIPREISKRVGFIEIQINQDLRKTVTNSKNSNDILQLLQNNKRKKDNENEKDKKKKKKKKKEEEMQSRKRTFQSTEKNGQTNNKKKIYFSIKEIEYDKDDIEKVYQIDLRNMIRFRRNHRIVKFITKKISLQAGEVTKIILELVDAALTFHRKRIKKEKKPLNTENLDPEDRPEFAKRFRFLISRTLIFQKIKEALKIEDNSKITKLIDTLSDERIKMLRDPELETILSKRKNSKKLQQSQILKNRSKTVLFDLETIINRMTQEIISEVVNNKLGNYAFRIFNLLCESKMLDERNIGELTMIGEKESKIVLYQLFNEKFVSLQSIPKTKDHASTKSFHLWKVNLEEQKKKMLFHSYKTIYNLFLRRNYELKQAEDLKSKVLQETLSEYDQTRLNDLGGKKFLLEHFLFKIDSDIELLRDFSLEY
ncbi:RNA polymerase iii DNA directed -related [Anaeramoeba flamelloides]|uniref:DNA-directed RNA polymerase III subunit RPC3 n=1 Tax=Anaeramoeba flamelloides TaxID=1746091 RepID=A0AAV7YKU6_9EUKA|nr:RNA polymerase iii DNA directed -related [Anaeramoeba flamelloides]